MSLAYHLSPASVSGGFVGVDVFFVISGYLISAVIFSEIATCRYSVLAFYERRIRRIFPALFGMLIGLSTVISFFLLPKELLIMQNLQLRLPPLLRTSISGTIPAILIRRRPAHCCTLGHWRIEEQFYILFPLFLVITRRFFPQ